MNQYIIYADVLFALNFFLDFFLFWVAGRILRRNIRLLRILAASLIGAAYGLSLLIPSLIWLTHPFCMFVVSALLLRVAYQWSDPKSFLKLAGVFYLSAFAMAGAALAGERLLEQNGINLGPTQTLQSASLVFAIFIAIILGRKGMSAIKKNWHKDDYKIQVQIEAAGQSCQLDALIDTGNDLREPISGYPVMVVEYSELKKIFPQYLREAFEKRAGEDPSIILDNITKTDSNNWRKRLRLIPFSSVGEENGLMLGFRPDKLIMKGANKKQTNQVIVCISFQSLGDGFTAVVNPEILNGGEKYKEAS